MDAYQIEIIRAREDSKKSLVYTSVWLFCLLLLTIIIKFDARPDQLVDTPPLRSDEVIEEFQIDNVELEEAAGGSRGGGTPGSGRIAPPAEQTERVATASQSDFSHTSGNSNNHNSRTEPTVPLPQHAARTFLEVAAVVTAMALVTDLSAAQVMEMVTATVLAMVAVLERVEFASIASIFLNTKMTLTAE